MRQIGAFLLFLIALPSFAQHRFIASVSSGPTWTYENAGTCPTSVEQSCTIQLSGVNAGDLLVAYISIDDASGSPTASDGTSSFTITTSLVNTNYGGSFSSQWAYLLSSVVTGSPTYTFTGPSGSNIAVTLWHFRPSGTVYLDSAPTGTAYDCNTSPESSPTLTPSAGKTDLIFGGVMMREATPTSVTLDGVSPTATKTDTAYYVTSMSFYNTSSSAEASTATFTTGCEDVSVQIIGFHQ